jgi:hypothetical protein
MNLRVSSLSINVKTGIGAGAGIMLVVIIILVIVVFPNDEITTSLTAQERADQRLEEKKKEMGWDDTVSTLTAQERADQRLEEKKKEMGWDAGTTQTQQNEIEPEEVWVSEIEPEEVWVSEIDNQRISEEQDKQKIIEKSRTNPLLKGLITGEIFIYVAPTPSYVSNEVRTTINNLKNSMNFPTANTPVQLKTTNNPNNADISISWIKNSEGKYLGVTLYKSAIVIALGSENCMGDWQSFDVQTIVQTIVHELGHSLGNNHSNDPKNIMYSKIDNGFEKYYDKKKIIDEGSLITIPFCSSGQYSYSLKGNSQSNGFLAYVITAGTDAKEFLQKGDGDYYTDCSSDNVMTGFSRTCNVQQEDALLIYNKNDLLKFGAITVDVSIIDQTQRRIPNMWYTDDTLEYDKEYLQKVLELFQ